jgi:tetratricopeptide (TPR) repeat protein
VQLLGVGSGAARWSSERGRLARDLAGALGASPGRRAPSATVLELRGLALEDVGRWTSRAAELVLEWPADPAIRLHAALPAALAGEPTDQLRAARDLAPHEESELHWLALEAARVGRSGLSRRLRELLVRLHPERIDYVPELARLVFLSDGPEAALRVVDAARGRLDRAALERLRPGADPEDHPLALPAADLERAAGWYLARLGENGRAALAYGAAASLYGHLGRPAEQAEALNNQGVVLVEGGRAETAALRLREALDLREGNAPLSEVAETRYNLARALADAGRAPLAWRSWLAAAQDYDRAGLPVEAIDALVESLESVIALDDPQALEAQVADILGRVEALPPDSRPGELEGWTWYELGRGRNAFADFDGSVQAYGRSLDVWRALEKRRREGQTLYSRAIPLLGRFDFALAHADLVQALRIAVEVNDTASIVIIREQLAQVAELVRQAGGQELEYPPELRPWLQ